MNANICKEFSLSTEPNTSDAARVPGRACGNPDGRHLWQGLKLFLKHNDTIVTSQ